MMIVGRHCSARGAKNTDDEDLHIFYYEMQSYSSKELQIRLKTCIRHGYLYFEYQQTNIINIEFMYPG